MTQIVGSNMGAMKIYLKKMFCHLVQFTHNKKHNKKQQVFDAKLNVETYFHWNNF